MTGGLANLARFDELDFYVRHFTDPALWAAHVQAACRHHGLLPCERIRSSLAGTYPTFIVEDRWVVKFFGRLFEGAHSFAAEREANELVHQVGGIPVPPLLGSGRLLPQSGDSWDWPYLIWAFAPGVSFGEDLPRLGPSDQEKIAAQMGHLTRRLHAIQVPPDSSLSPGPGPGWDSFLNFLAERRLGCLERHRSWGSLPPHLLEQVESCLLPVEELLDPGPPHLIHADLTRDHLLGRFAPGGWQLEALIDFGDAQVGSLSYELGALYFDLFQAQPRLLQVFLDAYGLSTHERQALPRKALSAALLHRFNLFSGYFKDRRQVERLEEIIPAWAAGV
jgi:hygromycin-B 7''-O-kinase